MAEMKHSVLILLQLKDCMIKEADVSNVQYVIVKAVFTDKSGSQSLYITIAN